MRIASFNLENLFSRYLFVDAPSATDEKKLLPTGITSFDAFGNAQSEAITLIQRNHTARVILDTQPDVLAVIEVESLKALRLFNDEYLSSYFDRMILIEGNDGRGINVGLCIRRGFDAKVIAVRTHADEALKQGWKIARYFDGKEQVLKANDALFSRDCLEVDIDVGVEGAITPLTLLVNHLKSQSGSSEEKKAGTKLRKQQAERVAALARDVRVKTKRLPIVLGDLNADWNETKKDKDGNPQLTDEALSLASIKQLVTDKVLADPFPASPAPWTHYFVPFDSVSRLDYILVDPLLATDAKARYERRGLTRKCNADKDEPGAEHRYSTIGYVGTEASDHCLVSVDLTPPPRSKVDEILR